MIRLLAVLMAGVGGAAWLLISRWERPGKGAEHRYRLRPPRLIRLGLDNDFVTAVALVYPVLVVIAPGWAYEGWTNWSSGIDPVFQAIGLVLWMLGMGILLWASRVMGRHLAVNGVAVNHELVTRGPYRYVRHPVYASFIAIALGTTLVFRSYVLLALSVVATVTSLWWADAEEKLLASPDGFGDAYRAYAANTGRFLPKLK
jgi:protein-S-isoprenylcysteine O-methyltransferase Ste14